MVELLERPNQRNRVRPNPAIFDLSHLQQYTSGDSGLERELLDLFLRQMPVIVTQVREAQTVYEWKFAFHTLKGSARAIGANAIGDLADALEANAALTDGDWRDQVMCRIALAIEDFKAEVRRLDH